MAQEFRELNASLPDTINLTSEGVNLDGPDGATASLPWRNFAGWRERHRVVLIDQTERRGFVIVPVAELEAHRKRRSSADSAVAYLPDFSESQCRSLSNPAVSGFMSVAVMLTTERRSAD